MIHKYMTDIPVSTRCLRFSCLQHSIPYNGFLCKYGNSICVSEIKLPPVYDRAHRFAGSGLCCGFPALVRSAGHINEHRSAKMRKCRCMKLLRAVSGCPLQERIFIFLCFCTAKLVRSRTALLLPDGCWMRCCGSCTGCGLRDFEKLEGPTLQGLRAFDSVVPIQFPVMIFMISRSVSRMPTRPRRPTFLIVPSTPSARIPSPAQKLLPVRHIS